MGVIRDLLNKVNTRKYQRIKKKYVDRFKANGELSDASELHDFIVRKKLPLISANEKYGDQYDSIEELFLDNDEILETIRNTREENILKNTLRHELWEITPENAEENLEDLEQECSKFARHYKITSDEPCFGTEYEKKMKGIDKICQVLNSISDKPKNSAYIRLYRLVEIYSMANINITKDFQKKEEIMTLTKQVLDYISSSVEDKHFFEMSKIDFGEFVSQNANLGTKKFLERYKEKQVLRSMGINSSIDDEMISFIDASDQEAVKKFYSELGKEKRQIVCDERKFTVNDFAMVRTTPYFPENREMEIVDDLNSRVYRGNFLTAYLTDMEMKKIYGDNYLQNFFSNAEMIEKNSELHDRFSTLTTTYRSTKHFTLNGLVSSHMYGNFDNNPFIIIDPLSEHINKENILSVNEADTYFQISREKPMQLSNKAELMMPVEEYLKRKNDRKFQKQLCGYKLTLFAGDEKKAVDMKLKQMGYIPEDIGMWGYDFRGFGEVMNNAVSELSQTYNVPIAVHYESDVKYADQEVAIKMGEKSNNEFVEFIFSKLGIDPKFKQAALDQKIEFSDLKEIISGIGVDKVIKAIDKYNQLARESLDKKREEFREGSEPKKEAPAKKKSRKKVDMSTLEVSMV